jgi:hypothetical protein
MKLSDEKFRPLAIKDFSKKIICDGHLYLSSKQGRRFYLMKPGILIDESFIKKHASNQTTFDYIPVCDDIIMLQFRTLFRELKYLHFEKDLRLKTIEIVTFFKEVFQKENHFLSFALVCYEEFCALPSLEQKRMHEADLHLFRKSLYSAAFSVIIALSNDFYHYPMIKDFYNLSLGLDIGLCETHYSYFVAEACNNENYKPGSGKNWMKKEGASDFEIDVFLSHPEKSYAFFTKHSDILAYPELKEVALYQHELSNGQGFPRGIPKGQVSSWEAVVILANSMVEIRDEYQFENDVLGFLLSFQNQKLVDIPVQRVYRKLCMVLGDSSRIEESAG